MTDLSTGPSEDRVPAGVRLVVVLGLLYTFLVGVSLLEAGIKAMGSDLQADLFQRVENPLAGVFVGLLGTVLVQSSSVTTATIVGLVGSGLLGVGDAVPMVMGANMGTTVTNTLASLGHVRHGPEFKRAFAAATVHDFFNVLSVTALLPLELAFGVISGPAEWLSEQLVGTSGSTWESPIKQWVKEPVGRVEDLLDGVGSGNALAALLLVVGLSLIFLALALITKNMRTLVAERVERSVNEVLSRGGGLVAMVLGMIITVSVQSSSITTSILIPLTASGVLSLANAYPVTLGANVGTTITALLASLATNRPEALTVALSHTLFNIGGIALYYPIPRLRRMPIWLAEHMAEIAAHRRSLAIAYVVGTFIVLPLVGLLVLG